MTAAFSSGRALISLIMCNNDPQGLALFCEYRSAIMVFLTLNADPLACVLAPTMFMLFSKAYPCIIDVDADICLTPHLVLVLGVLLPSL
ncbi:hypothetical protein M438DRAFT_3025 [Aureobasidium pullulans EXF-150]|uniref:Uncharacterized protein n=1 Tax=Aureobasidium pullulans EXF-150 TaxID=1043002 RepID=A0A074XUF8_AURPU|nr:uncharacterized protein M438DRAFT_3025 [Aureobasidium pullulans EXF-150]KEQ89223.1 hypothetical protein M438DRAFT_3025 [Aureobasidium pullulans EXF-150]